MKLSARIADRLRCPRCLSELASGEQGMSCAGSCGLTFPVVEGVPILVDECRSIVSSKTALAASKSAAPARSFRAHAKRWLPRLERNVASERTAEQVASLLFERVREPLLLNVGGKHPDASLAGLRKHSQVECVELDVRKSPGTDLVSDFGALPFAAGTFDAVVLDAVLEHVVDPSLVVAEAHRVLGSGGLVYSDIPFMLQVHAGAFDFHRFTHLGHRRLFRCFEEVDSGISQGPGTALAYSIQYFGLSFVRSNRARFALKAMARLLFFWLKYFDGFLVRRPGAFDAALGFYFVGRKQHAPLSDYQLLEGYRGNTPDLHERPAL